MTNQAKWSDFASMDGQKMATAASQLLPGWVSLVLVLLIGWQLAQLVWLMIPAPAAGDAVATPPRIAATPNSGSAGADVNAIAAAHIFGIANAIEEAPPPAPEEYEDLADTRLSNLSLKGTIAAEPPETAVAIIADGGNKEQVYTIGSSVANNAKLHAVYADRVVLNENGVLTNLKLPKEFSEAGSCGPVVMAFLSEWGKYSVALGCHSSNAVFCRRPAARVSGIPRTEPRPVHGIGPAAWRSGQRH